MLTFVDDEMLPAVEPSLRLSPPRSSLPLHTPSSPRSPSESPPLHLPSLLQRPLPSASAPYRPSPDPSDPGLAAEEPLPDSIRVDYHPHSGRPPQVFPFESYRREHDRAKFNASQLLKENPWAPFKSREDFELAELCVEAGLHKKQINKLLKLIQDAKNGKAKISLSSYKDLQMAWDSAKIGHTGVCHISC